MLECADGCRREEATPSQPADIEVESASSKLVVLVIPEFRSQEDME